MKANENGIVYTIDNSLPEYSDYPNTINERVEFTKLKDKIIKHINCIKNEEGELVQFIFTCANGEIYKQYHTQGCCETVYVEDINGDLEDLLNEPILLANETSSKKDMDDYHMTWTFYNLSTIKGSVCMRWMGKSNGCYSETAELIRYYGH
jgi:hypothetical protein